MGRLPEVRFGAGAVDELPQIVEQRSAARVVILTGAASLRKTALWDALRRELQSVAEVRDFSVAHEPTPDVVDHVVNDVRAFHPELVVSIGGGSVIDAGKAVSAMVCESHGVKTYLEGVGTEAPSGRKITFVAAPTTAGTGSEATKNAVISRTGPGGFKKSLRHDNFVPDVALIDPVLAQTSPPQVTAAAGMDAVTQLLEAFVSTKAHAMTDALCRSGLEHAARCLEPAVRNGNDTAARAGMAYGAYLSGVVLANVGLGIVHGLASPLGAHFHAPHGAVCGALITAASRVVIEQLRRTDDSAASIALAKYAEAGRVLSGRIIDDVAGGCDALVGSLERLRTELQIPSLSELGVSEADIGKVASEAGAKNTPAALAPTHIEAILSDSL